MNFDNYTVKFLTLNEQEILRNHLHKYMRENEYESRDQYKIKNIPNIILLSKQHVTKQNLKEIYHNEHPILFLTSKTDDYYLVPISCYCNNVYKTVSIDNFFSKNYYCKHMVKHEHVNIIDSYMMVPNERIDVKLIHNKIIMYLNEIFILLKELTILDITTNIYKIYIDLLFKKIEI